MFIAHIFISHHVDFVLNTCLSSRIVIIDLIYIFIINQSIIIGKSINRSNDQSIIESDYIVDWLTG